MFQSEIMGIQDKERRLSGVKVICLNQSGGASPSNGVSCVLKISTNLSTHILHIYTRNYTRYRNLLLYSLCNK